MAGKLKDTKLNGGHIDQSHHRVTQRGKCEKSLKMFRPEETEGFRHPVSHGPQIALIFPFGVRLFGKRRVDEVVRDIWPEIN